MVCMISYLDFTLLVFWQQFNSRILIQIPVPVSIRPFVVIFNRYIRIGNNLFISFPFPELIKLIAEDTIVFTVSFRFQAKICIVSL